MYFKKMVELEMDIDYVAISSGRACGIVWQRMVGVGGGILPHVVLVDGCHSAVE